MKSNPVSWLKTWFLVSAALGLSACSLFSKDDPALLPKPLPDIKMAVELDEVWSRGIGKGQGKNWLKLQPAIDNETLYVADAQGLVMAVRSDNGKVLWRKTLNSSVSGGVTASERQVLVGTLDGYIIALNREDGEELWRSSVTSEVLGAPATDGRVVVVQTIDDKVSGFSASDGKKLWQQNTLQPLLTLRGSGAPLIADGVVYTGFANGEAKAYRVSNGSLVWESRVAIPKGSSELERMVDVDGYPVLSGGSLYMVSYQGNVVAMDPDSGRIRWAREASSYQGLAEGFGNLYLSDEQAILSAVDQRTGSIIWSQKDLERRHLSGPATWSSYVLVGDYEGYLHVVSQLDGKLLGRKKIDSSGIRSRPVVSGDMIYVYGNSGDLSALKIR